MSKTEIIKKLSARLQRCALFVVILIALLFALAGRAEAQFFDDFNSGPSPLWGNELGSWHATGGVYQSQFPSNSPVTRSMLPFVMQDFVVEMDINDIQDGGVWLRGSNLGTAGSENGILLVTGGGSTSGTGLYWHVFTNGSYTPSLNVISGLFTPGVSDIHLRVEVTGDTYSAFLNGSSTAATTLTNSDFESGQAGLYDFSGQTFDNVSVVPEPVSSMLFIIGGIILGLRRFLKIRNMP